MDVAEVEAGHRVLCLNPTGSLRPAIRALAGAFGPVSRGVATAEALVLKHRGANVTTDAASVAIMGANLMDPDRRSAVSDAAIAQGRRLAVRGRRQAA